MDGLSLLFLIPVVALLLIGAGALGWGSDSRPSIPDDHRR